MTAIVTLTFNPAIDVSTSVERMMPSHKLRCAEAQRDPGGGGINVARVLRRWRSDVFALYPAGGPTGELLKRLVDREGIRSRAVEIAEDTREDFTVFENSTGNQYRFVFPGLPLTEAECQAVYDTLTSIDPRPRFVIASGSLPTGVPADSYAHVARIANTIGARLIVDSSGPALKEALNEGVYLIKPNLRELGELTGLRLKEESDWLTACRSLVDSKRVGIVALTLGEQGALAVTREGAWRAYSPRIRALSTVGAGDSFLGTMIWRLASGHPLADALAYGVAAGSAALLAPGTELSRPADTERLLSEVTIRKILP